MKKGIIITVVLIAAITAGYYLVKQSPSETDVSPQTELLNKKVDEAVLIIQSAEGAPMQGIAILREVLNEDPNHVKANYWMGEFSWISGQFDKAVPRFEKVLEIEPNNAEAAKRLVAVFIQLKENEKAKGVADTFADNNPNHEANAEMNNMLNNI